LPAAAPARRPAGRFPPSAQFQETCMETKYLLLMLWIIVVLLWLVNTFYYQNQKRELEYRRKKYPKQNP